MNKLLKTLVLLFVFTSTTYAQTVKIDSYAEELTYNGEPLYILSSCSIKIALIHDSDYWSNDFSQYSIDGELIENFPTRKTPYPINLDNYYDGKIHKLSLWDTNGWTSWSADCYFIVGTQSNDPEAINIGDIFYKITSQSNLEMQVVHKYAETPAINESYSGEIIIPPTVNYNNRTYTITSIGDYVFGGLVKGSQICSITLPNTLKAIYPYAFANSTLEEIYISDGIESIGDYAFSNCEKLQIIKIPDTTQYLGESIFNNCSKLSEVQIGSQIEEIPVYAFYNCFSLSDVKFGANVKYIGHNAFSYCYNLHNLQFNNALREIGTEAFYGCSQLSYIILGTGLEKIGSYSFSYCPNLLEVFYTSPNKPNGKVESTNSHMESYVPSTRIYGFGIDYVTFSEDNFEYTGASHLVEGTNNIKYLICEMEQPCETEVDAGEYTKMVQVNYSGDVELTLDIPYTYTIKPAPLTLAVADAEREYGEPNPTFTCSATGFVPGENLSNIGSTPIYQCEATQLSNVGTYKILAELEAKNYDITYKYGTLTVNKAPITATVVDSSKIYGDSNPLFELSYNDLKNNGVTPSWITKPVFSTSADLKSPVGEYEVTVTGGESQNYTVSKYTPGILSVLKRDLRVKANNAERLYGEENPVFQISFSGFVNSDSQNDLLTQPEAYCNATVQSNAGEYPIFVEGGSAENYSMVYERGTLYVNPLTVGFKNVYNTVKFDDMAVSTTDRYFNYLPEIEGPFNEDDFYIDLWFIDGDNKYSNHVYTEASGSYKGSYVNTNYDRPMQAGKYIFNLTSKGTNPNVVANPSRCYLTVETNSTNLAWNDSSPINVKVGETVELDISYLAYIYCQFNVDYDEDLITLTASNQMSNNSQWFVSGLKEGETTINISISCLKNDMGFYDFYDSKTVSNRIKVLPAGPINAVETIENEGIIIRIINNVIYTEKPEEIITYVYDLSGKLIVETSDSQIENLQRGIYIVRAGNKVKKIIL